MARYGFSPATRVFEAAGAAACLITDAWTGLETFLEPGREVLVAAAAQARGIGLAARVRVLAEHTYAHRVVQVERRAPGVRAVVGRGPASDRRACGPGFAGRTS
jgi:spore maturation protein CgeB